MNPQLKIGKYEFNSKEQAKSKIDALGEHNHSIVELGHIVIEEGEYDDNGNTIKEPVLYDKYCVDVCWCNVDDHPYGWKSYDADLDNEGVHSFFGITYLDNKCCK